MRVLFLTMWYPSEDRPAKANFVREHARAAAMFHQISILHIAGPREGSRKRWEYETSEGSAASSELPTARMRYRQLGIPGTRYLQFLLAGATAISRLARSSGPWDVIHAHEFDAALLGVLAGMRLGIPVVATEHSSVFMTGSAAGRAVWRARFAFERCAYVLPVSQALGEAIEGFGIRARMRVVPNTVETSLFHPPRRSVSVEGDRAKRVTVVSNMKPLKDLPNLLRACTVLAEERGDWTLDVIGDGPMRFEHEDQARRLGLADRVTFHGIQPREKVAQLLQQADVHVVPSLKETFSVAAAEALACGTPVVATRCGGPEELITEDVGLLVEPGDPVALASAVNRVLTDGVSSRESISHYASTKFSHRRVGGMLSDIYLDAAESRQRLREP